ncbi:MAG: hypothetical protein APF82_06925 [Sphingomonadales bacterium BRH_c42]|nr:MAG: hypothetical protein APF82_06925 [Sphingomonadales bacterium BRH_c42]
MNVPAGIAEWRGKIAFAPMSALFCGFGGITPIHNTAAHKVIIGVRAIRSGGMQLDPRNPAIIPAGEAHSFDGRNQVIACAWLDARHYRLEDAASLADRWSQLAPSMDSIDGLQEDIGKLSPRVLGKRLTRAMHAIEALPTIGAAANSVGLSESRFTHAVTDELGAPPRSWRRWLRLRRAIDLIASGYSVTAAAHEAGFADSAHFSRICFSDLGLRPSALKTGQLKFRRSSENCELNMI